MFFKIEGCLKPPVNLLGALIFKELASLTLIESVRLPNILPISEKFFFFYSSSSIKPIGVGDLLLFFDKELSFMTYSRTFKYLRIKGFYKPVIGNFYSFEKNPKFNFIKDLLSWGES